MSWGLGPGIVKVVPMSAPSTSNPYLNDPLLGMQIRGYTRHLFCFPCPPKGVHLLSHYFLAWHTESCLQCTYRNHSIFIVRPFLCPISLYDYTQRGNPCTARTLRAHCALLLDYVPPKEPTGTPLGNTLRIRRPKLDWRGTFPVLVSHKHNTNLGTCSITGRWWAVGSVLCECP